MSTRLTSRRAWVEIDLANLIANARGVLAAAAGRPRLLPMVKADAYGLGVRRCVEALESVDPWGYGVATVEEGVQLREFGIDRPALVFTPPAADDEAVYGRYDLTAVIDDPEVAAGWRHPFHVEIDTGMGRCGVRWDDEQLPTFAAGPLEGVFTHLHSADRDPASVAVQWERFRLALARLPPRARLVHVANSAGVWRLQEPLDLVRPGIYLYGGLAGADLPAPKPVAAVKAPVVSLRALRAGETVSYGATWTAPRDTTIATLGIGYADGVFRAVSGKGEVILGGRRVPLVGRVTMDFIMVDLGARTATRVGDTATVVGREGAEAITVDQFAAWAGTISYEVLARLGTRLERRYLNG